MNKITNEWLWKCPFRRRLTDRDWRHGQRAGFTCPFCWRNSLSNQQDSQVVSLYSFQIVFFQQVTQSIRGFEEHADKPYSRLLVFSGIHSFSLQYHCKDLVFHYCLQGEMQFLTNNERLASSDCRTLSTYFTFLYGFLLFADFGYRNTLIRGLQLKTDSFTVHSAPNINSKPY